MNDLVSRKAVKEYLIELCNTKDTSAYGLQLMGNYEAMRIKMAQRDCLSELINEFDDIDFDEIE